MTPEVNTITAHSNKTGWLLQLTSDRFKRLGREVIWVGLGQGAAVLGALVGVRVLTELLDPAAYGELALGMTVATLVNQTVLGPLGNGITRFYTPAVEQRDVGGYLNEVGRMVLSATGIIGLLILFAVAGLLIAGRADWIAIVTAALIFAILSGYNSILSGMQNAIRQRSVVALHQGMESWARFLVAAALMVWLGATSTMAIVGYSVAAILVLGSQYVFLPRIAPKYLPGTEREKNWREQIWTYSWPISLFGVFTWVQLASDRWALGLSATTQEVGLYAVLFQLGYYPMSLASGMAMQFLAPIFFQRAGDASDSRRNENVRNLSWRFTGLSLGLTSGAFLLMLLFHAEIFRLLVAEEYASVSYLLPWTLLAGGVFAAGETIALSLMSQLNTRAMIAPKIITALLGVTLHFAGATWYGITGVVIAGIIFSVLYFLWMAAIFRRTGVRK